MGMLTTALSFTLIRPRTLLSHLTDSIKKDLSSNNSSEQILVRQSVVIISDLKTNRLTGANLIA